MRPIDEIVHEFEAAHGANPSRRELEGVFRASPLYSHRYLAGKNLGKITEVLSDDIGEWIPQIKTGLQTTKSHTEIFNTWREVPYQGNGCGYDPEPTIENSYPKVTWIPDDESRLRCLQDTSSLFALSNHPGVRALIRDTYLKNDSPETQKEAGRQLEYSAVRIFLSTERIYQGAAKVIATAILVGAMIYCPIKCILTPNSKELEKARIEREKELAPYYPPGYFNHQKEK